MSDEYERQLDMKGRGRGNRRDDRSDRLLLVAAPGERLPQPPYDQPAPPHYNNGYDVHAAQPPPPSYSRHDQPRIERRERPETHSHRRSNSHQPAASAPSNHLNSGRPLNSRWTENPLQSNSSNSRFERQSSRGNGSNIRSRGGAHSNCFERENSSSQSVNDSRSERPERTERQEKRERPERSEQSENPPTHQEIDNKPGPSGRYHRERPEIPIEEGEFSGAKRKFEGESSERKVPPAKRRNETGGQGKRDRNKLLFDNIKTRPADLVNKKGITPSSKIVPLKVNYFKLEPNRRFQLSQYSVTFVPDSNGVEGWTNRQKSMFIGTNKQILGGYLYDGTSLYLSKRMETDEMVFEVTTREGDEVRVTIKYVRDIDMISDLAFQVFNLILRTCFTRSLGLELVGRYFYDPRQSKQIHGHSLELWPGYITSIRQYENDILLNTDISHKVMRNETLLDMLKALIKPRIDYKTEFARSVIGLTVLTDYNNKTYKISDVDFDQSPSSTFPYRGGERSYKDYYLEKYSIDIRDVKQPLLISNPKKKDIRGGRDELICLIPELCRPTGIAPSMKKNFRQMMELARHLRLRPQNRVEALARFSQKVLDSQSRNNVLLQEYNLNFDRKLVELKGRELPAMKIHFGDGHQQITNSWENAFKSNKMLSCIQLKKWVLIHPSSARHEVDNFLRSLKQVCRQMGFIVEDPCIKIINDPSSSQYYHCIIESKSLHDPMFFVCVIPSNAAIYYEVIKSTTLVQLGIPSQVIVQRTMSKNPMSVATKIGIQINAKLGGTPWLTKIPFENIMIVGYDVSHDTSNRKQSWGALVASLNTARNAFYSTVNHHKDGSELASNIATNFVGALRAYQKHNKQYPERIIFYRDGVGDGEIEYIVNYEVQGIEKIFKQYYCEGQFPQFAYILVSKRTNTRIFTLNNQNPNPGTVVDDVITMNERFDFYLVSTSDRQSTVSPTYYNVIKSTFKNDPARFQELTYNLCHLYYNWNGTIRVPAICQYARKLSFLVGQFLKQPCKSELSDKLHFL